MGVGNMRKFRMQNAESNMREDSNPNPNPSTRRDQRPPCCRSYYLPSRPTSTLVLTLNRPREPTNYLPTLIENRIVSDSKMSVMLVRLAQVTD